LVSKDSLILLLSANVFGANSWALSSFLLFARGLLLLNSCQPP
jgi:hypothetical protein